MLNQANFPVTATARSHIHLSSGVEKAICSSNLWELPILPSGSYDTAMSRYGAERDVVEVCRGRSRGFVRRARHTWQFFQSATGCNDLVSSTHSEADAYVREAFESGYSTSIVRFSLRLLNQLRTLAMTREGLTEPQLDPFLLAEGQFRKLRYIATADARLNLEGLWCLLGSEEFCALKRSTRLIDVAAYWSVLLALWAGIESHDLCNLRPSDLFRLDGEGYMIRISGQPEIEAGEEWQPVHGELVRCGFVDFVERRKTAGAAYLLHDGGKLDGSDLADTVELRIARMVALDSSPSDEFTIAAPVEVYRLACTSILRDLPPALSWLFRKDADIGGNAVRLFLVLSQSIRFDDEVNWRLHHA